MAQHRFAEALDVGRELLALDSTSVAARGLVAETELELGRYDEAGRLFGQLATYEGDIGVAPRLARWDELHGRPEEARRLLRLARDEAGRRHAMPKEQIAWFHLRLGDLALGYSVSNATTVYPGIRYTGRLAGDSLGEMTLGEGVLIDGSGSQLVSHRWGDYTDMTVDPTDGCTFWYVNEYYQTSSARGWQTRIGSFRLPGC